GPRLGDPGDERVWNANRRSAGLGAAAPVRDERLADPEVREVAPGNGQAPAGREIVDARRVEANPEREVPEREEPSDRDGGGARGHSGGAAPADPPEHAQQQERADRHPTEAGHEGA